MDRRMEDIHYCSGSQVISRDGPPNLKSDLWAVTWALILLFSLSFSRPVWAADPATNIVLDHVVVSFQGKVEVQRAGAKAWDLAYTNQVLETGDRLRTGERCRAVIRMSDQTLLRIGELGLVEIPATQDQRSRFRFLKGVFYFFHRGPPGEYEVQTPGLATIIRGTEFNLEVSEDGVTSIAMIDGTVEMTNAQGYLLLRSGEVGQAKAGEKPLLMPVLETINIIQWNLYYPGFLYLPELGLTLEESDLLKDSLEAYRLGDVALAVERFPHKHIGLSAHQRLFQAALLLGVGKVEESEKLLALLASAEYSTGEPSRFREIATALRKIVGAVQFKEWSDSTRPETASGWLAEVYYQQSRSRLEAARAAARKATELGPDFAFAWEQLAELEFGFGRIREAQKALDKARVLAPRNAQAWALEGFLLLAQNQVVRGRAAFAQAIALDGSLANGWLGHGLATIRQGRIKDGLNDLEVAATVEPQRAIIRSYLGKAFQQNGDELHALAELDLARIFDLRDPTPWFYSALIRRQQNRLNDAVNDLEHSQLLNKNRSVYRSQLLLDQDRAVRSANLAAVYREAGLIEPGFQEAVKAVSADYANYSAHLFLADTYDALRDPQQVNLRYEAPWLREYLLAQLLAPVGAGQLSPNVTAFEYSRLFERDRLGLASSTEYGSQGDWRQTASQFGAIHNLSYAVDTLYLSQTGDRPNNDLEELGVTVRVKEQFTPQDTVFLQVDQMDAKSGDLAQYYDPRSASTGLRVHETQTPNLVAGYHHQWSPESHTLFLGSFLQNSIRWTDPEEPMTLLFKSFTSGRTVTATSYPSLDYRNDFTAYAAELQHLWQHGGNTLILGGRLETGTFDMENKFGPSLPARLGSILISSPAWTGQASTSTERLSFYGYNNWQVFDWLGLIGGLSYDYLSFPDNVNYPPVSGTTTSTSQVSPKAGLVLTPGRDTTLRFGYTRSLGGVSYENSYRLEPSQIAGFSQAYRSLIPESVAGSVSGERMETIGVAVQQKIGRATYVSAEAQRLSSEANRAVGALGVAFSVPNGIPTFDSVKFFPATLAEHLDYTENSLALTFNQLWGRDWSFGSRYCLSQAELRNRFRDLPGNSMPAMGEGDQTGLMHRVNLSVLFNHPSGFFSQLEALWMAQLNEGYNPPLPNDDFWQLNGYIGYRFFQRRAEGRLGLLNLTGQDYHLNPLNLTTELPRERTLVLSFRWVF
jgi:Tfp pilus assembly protein PilF